MENATLNSLVSEALQNAIKQAADKIYQEQKDRAIKELNAVFEEARLEMIHKCAVELQSRFRVDSSDMEIVIRVKK